MEESTELGELFFKGAELQRAFNRDDLHAHLLERLKKVIDTKNPKWHTEGEELFSEMKDGETKQRLREYLDRDGQKRY